MHTIPIAPGGDLVLQVSQEEQGPQFLYRVDSSVLKQQSQYFDNLLSDRFSEGQELTASLEVLKVQYLNISEAPPELLHVISIVNVGRTSKISSIQNLVADLLRALHGQDLSVPGPPVANLANIAVVADRFDALSCLTKYVRKKKFLQLVDAKAKGKVLTSISEERIRQKLLIGLLFDHPSWVTRYSKHLIMRDSAQWRPGFEPDDTAALWWDIPWGVEGASKRYNLTNSVTLTVSRRTHKTQRAHLRDGQLTAIALPQALYVWRKAVQARL